MWYKISIDDKSFNDVKTCHTIYKKNDDVNFMIEKRCEKHTKSRLKRCFRQFGTSGLAECEVFRLTLQRK